MRVTAVLAVLVLARSSGHALVPVPVGPAFTVGRSGYDAYYQNDGYLGRARAAGAPDGSFVVVWERYVENPSVRGVAVRARRFDGAGAPLGAEFEVDPAVGYGNPVRPDVDVAPNGEFIVTWSSYDTDVVRARRFDASGTAAGPAFDALPVDGQRHNGVAVAPDGGFLVATETFVAGFGNDVVARRFDAADVPLGPPLAVNTLTTGWQGYVDAAAGGGQFVVVWNDSYASAQGVFARRFDAMGAPAGDQFLALSHDDDELPPQVAAAADGSFVVVSGAGSGAGVVARRFDAAGTPLGPEIAVDTSGDSPGVAMDAAGTFLVVWRGEGLSARLYDAAGIPQGPPIDITPSYIEYQYQHVPGVAGLANGDFVVTWADDYDYLARGVYARRVGVCGNGTQTPGLLCDDGNAIAGDGCNAACDVETCFSCAGTPSLCAAIPGCTATCAAGAAFNSKTFLTVKRVLAPAGDESFTLKGAIVAPPVAAGAYDPSVEGAEVILTGTALLYERAVPTPVPAGVVGSGCGPLDGWKVSGTAPSRSFTYKNLTGALPPGCAPGSANGLRVMKVKDKIVKDGTLQVSVAVKNATLPPLPSAPVTATIVLGQSPVAGAAGRCARVRFANAYPAGSTIRYYP